MTRLDEASLVRIALEAVLAGAQLAERMGPTAPAAYKGSLRDIVAPTDIAVGNLLEAKLKATNLPVVSEECYSPSQAVPDVFWAVDPIDGSVNFAHEIALFAVSAGLVDKGAFPIGVVCAPGLDELYFTLSPRKALFNGRPFLHTHRPVAQALIAASFAATGARNQYDLFQQANESSRGCLRTGSAGLNICWAAVGKLQGAYGFCAKLWDVAGALAVARAAGCAVALQYKPGAMSIDYCVGSREVVSHLTGLAARHGLWEQDGRSHEPV